MFKSKIISALALTTLMSGCVVIAGSPSRADFHQREELTLDAKSLVAFDIEAGAGALIVHGEEGLTNIQITADIYTDKKNPNAYDLSLTQSGKLGYLVAKNSHTSGFWNGNSPHIDLTIRVPAHLKLMVDDGSGDIEISQMNGELNIKDGSGGISVKYINNNINIKDNSGGIDIQFVNGSVDIDDGSGEISVSNIEGELSIEDGSGAIYAKNVTGNVQINDGSGDLTVRNISGVVTLDDGSGNIDVEDTGGLKIIDAGSGGLRVNNVQGDLNIDSE